MRDRLTDALCRFAEGLLNEFLPIFLPVLLIAISAVGVGACAALIAHSILDPRACEAEWADYQHRWSFHGGCQIKIEGRWVPTNNVKIEPRQGEAA